MKRIYFIVNPISGKGKHQIDEVLLQNYFSSDCYEIHVLRSKAKKEAIKLAKQAIADKADIIVACGGDGTIHEVAAQLIGTEIAFGIIPVGSGNGLASNLSIPKNLEEAINLIKRNELQRMDVGRVNGRYFFSNMGFGIDATIIKNYEKSGKRKLGAYVKAALHSAKQYRAKPMRISYGEHSKIVNPLLLFISNSNEMGYYMSLTPKASLKDGLLDFLIVPKINILKQLYFGFLVVIRQSHKFKNAQYLQLNSMQVEILNTQSNTLQLDGEYYKFDTHQFEIKVLPRALHVIC